MFAFIIGAVAGIALGAYSPEFFRALAVKAWDKIKITFKKG